MLVLERRTGGRNIYCLGWGRAIWSKAGMVTWNWTCALKRRLALTTMSLWSQGGWRRRGQLAEEFKKTKMSDMELAKWNGIHGLHVL